MKFRLKYGQLEYSFIPFPLKYMGVLLIPHLRVVSTNIYPVTVLRSSPLAIANQSTVAS